jgi:hypothetical protein
MSFIDPNADSVKFKRERLIEFPDLSQFNNITRINLSHNYITKLKLDLFPPNVTVIKLSNNNIGGHVDNTIIPSNVEILELNNNEIVSFDGIGFKNLQSLSIQCNKLIKFTFPPNLKMLEIYENDLTSLSLFPKTMKGIDFSHNCLKMMPPMNEELKELYCGQNQISLLSGLPTELEDLDASDNNISLVPWLPSKLKNVKLAGNKITDLPCVGLRRLAMLDISDNMFDNVPRLPPNITHLNISDNRLIHITAQVFPSSITHLDISNNVIDDIPYVLKIRCHTFKHHGNYASLGDNSPNFNDDDDDYEYLTDTSKRGRTKTLDDYGFNDEDYSLGYNGYNTKKNHYDNTNYGLNNKNDYSDYNRYNYYNYDNEYCNRYNYNNNTNYYVDTSYQENLKNPLCVSVYNTKQVEL